jgi:hypothetical protein
MKRAGLYFLLMLMGLRAFAITDKIKLGLAVSPGLSWLQPQGKNVKLNAVGFAAQYGIVLDYYFKGQNYGISTGIFGGNDAGSLSGRDSFNVWAGKSVTESYSNYTVTLPIYLKLKTNPIKEKWRVFGQIGMSFVFTASSRATFDTKFTDKTNGTIIDIYKENVLSSSNDVQRIIPGFKYQVFDARLSVGVGFEYEIKDKATPFFALQYHNGFVNVMSDGSVNPKNDGVLMRNFLFCFGVMF